MNTDTHKNLGTASVASRSPNQSNETRVDRVRIKWAQDEVYGDEILECVQAIAEVSYPISCNGDRRVEWITSGGLYGIENAIAHRDRLQFEAEQLDDLASHLSHFGISCSVSDLKNKL